MNWGLSGWPHRLAFQRLHRLKPAFAESFPYFLTPAHTHGSTHKPPENQFLRTEGFLGALGRPLLVHRVLQNAILSHNATPILGLPFLHVTGQLVIPLFPIHENCHSDLRTDKCSPIRFDFSLIQKQTHMLTIRYVTLAANVLS